LQDFSPGEKRVTGFIEIGHAVLLTVVDEVVSTDGLNQTFRQCDVTLLTMVREPNT
jgi:hypothetical protein